MDTGQGFQRRIKDTNSSHSICLKSELHNIITLFKIKKIIVVGVLIETTVRFHMQYQINMQLLQINKMLFFNDPIIIIDNDCLILQGNLSNLILWADKDYSLILLNAIL